MIRKLFVVFALLGIAAALPAEMATKKYDWKPVNGLQEVNVVAGKVVLSQLEFDLGSKMITPLQASTAQVNARVDNNGFISQEVGVAIAVFDAEEKPDRGRQRRRQDRLPLGRRTGELHGPFSLCLPEPGEGGELHRVARDTGEAAQADARPTRHGDSSARQMSREEP